MRIGSCRSFSPSSASRAAVCNSPGRLNTENFFHLYGGAAFLPRSLFFQKLRSQPLPRALRAPQNTIAKFYILCTAQTFDFWHRIGRKCQSIGVYYPYLKHAEFSFSREMNGGSSDEEISLPVSRACHDLFFFLMIRLPARSTQPRRSRSSMISRPGAWTTAKALPPMWT